MERNYIVFNVSELDKIDFNDVPYSHYEFLNILDTEVWNNPNKEPMR